MDHPNLNDAFRESAWRHFTIHAEQRLKMFQFYITISTALLGGGALLIRTDQYAIALVLLGFLASFLSFVFWKLEVRTRTLVKNAEDAIQYLDASFDLPDVDDEPNPLYLFARDDHRTRRSKRRCALLHFSYHKCFVLVFVLIAILGGFGMLYGLSEVLSMSPTTASSPLTSR